jgi:uncharacterized protein (TIGR02147 family)
VIDKIKPSDYTDYKDFLADVYNQLKAADPNYSYTEFSEDLDLGKCKASYKIIRGERPLTVKAAKRIAQKLGIRNKERQYFVSLVETARTKHTSEDDDFKKLIAIKKDEVTNEFSKQHLEFFANWYNAAILELFQLPDCRGDPDWIAQHINPRVSPGKIRKSLELLKSLGYLTDDGDGGLKSCVQNIETPKEILGLAFMRFHEQMIQLSKESLTNFRAKERHITGATLAIPAEMKETIIDEAEQFYERIMNLANEQDHKDTVYQINFQLFPISKK